MVYDLQVSGTRAAMVVNGVGGGGSPDEAIARSLVRETHEMRSLWNVVVEYRQRLTDDQAMVSTVLLLLGSRDAIRFLKRKKNTMYKHLRISRNLE